MNYEIGFYIILAMLIYSLLDYYFTKEKLVGKIKELEKENSKMKKDYITSTIGPDSLITKKLQDNYEKTINELVTDIKTLVLPEPLSTNYMKVKVIEKYELILEEKNKPLIYHLTKYF